MLDLAQIEQALRDGARLAAFTSGTNLRITKVEGNGIKGYGEGITLEESLLCCNHNLTWPNKEFGAPEQDFEGSPSLPDLRMGRGQKFNAWFDGTNICVRWVSLEEFKLPEGLVQQVIDTQEVLSYRDPVRKFVYLIKSVTLANLQRAVEVTTVYWPPKQTMSRGSAYSVAQEISNANPLYQQILNVLDAPKTEIFDE